MMFHENYYKTRLKIDVMQIKFIFLFLQTVCRSLERSVQSLTRDSIGRRETPPLARSWLQVYVRGELVGEHSVRANPIERLAQVAQVKFKLFESTFNRLSSLSNNLLGL
jgi:hypothetical protein